MINILLIPRIGAMGAVVGTIVAEMVLCVYQTWVARKYLHIREYLLNAGVLFMIGMVMYAVLVYISRELPVTMGALFIEIMVGILIYLSLLILYIFFSKNQVIVDLRNTTLKRIHLDKRK